MIEKHKLNLREPDYSGLVRLVVGLAVIAIFAILNSRCKEPEDPNPIGCQMGRNPANSLVWRTYRCATYKQFLAGSNPNAGGTTVWNSYKENKWELCPDCK